MRALLDESLSPKLGLALADLFEEVKHARELGLEGASDFQVWETAQRTATELLITTDRDFLEILAQQGPPPKVVRIARADVKTTELAALLRKHAVEIREMTRSPRSALVLRAR
jgi:predicted nuclease of predicted toxin-antitoxin system